MTIPKIRIALLAMVLFLPGSAHAISPACGATIGGPGAVVSIDSDVGPCAASALVVADGTLAVNLNGHTVSCADSLVTIGIDAIPVTNDVLISDGTITGCGNGVVGITVHIRDMLLTNGRIGFIGGTCEDSTASSNINDGLSLRKGVSKNCEALDNGQTGISLNGKATLRGATATGNGIHGIVVVDGARMRDIVASGNGGNGISLSGSGRSALRNSIVSDNLGSGVATITPVHRAAIADNIADNNGIDGFTVDGQARLIRNLSQHNARNGIRVKSTARHIGVLRNTATLNDGEDLYVETAGCTESRWQKNTFATSNDACIQ